VISTGSAFFGRLSNLSASAAVEVVTLSDNDTVALRRLMQIGGGLKHHSLEQRSGLSVGDLLRIGLTTEREFASVIALPNQAPGRLLMPATLS
jgi:predicted transcriptional regulator